MANQTSAASRRPKRSGASSAKDSTLGKKVVIDPRVRVQTLKAAREDVDIEDDDNGARPSNISSMSTSSTPVDVSRAGPSDSSSGPRKPNWKRVPLKRSTAHNLLVRPCGPGKIIMPSVPRRRPPPKPTNNDEGDTDKETDNPKTESQPSTYLSATQPSATSSATQPDDDAEEDINQPTRPNTPVPGCEDPNNASGSNVSSAATNVVPTMPPNPPSGTSDGSIGATSMAHGFPTTIPVAQPSTSVTDNSLPNHSQFTPVSPDSRAHQPHPTADISIVNYDYHHAFELRGQGTDEMPFDDSAFRPHHFCEVSTRPVMDVDHEMENSLQLYGDHAPTGTFPTAFGNQTIPAFSTHTQHLPAAEPNQLEATQPAQLRCAVDGDQGQTLTNFSLSLNNNQLNLPTSTSPITFGTFYQNMNQSEYDSNAAPFYSSGGSMLGVDHQPPSAVPHWQPQAQFSASAPASYVPYALQPVGQVQLPAFYPHVSYPIPTPVHQGLLPSQLQAASPDHERNLEVESTCLPLGAPSSSFIPPARQTARAAQHKTSVVLEPETEWTQRIAEVRPREQSNPFKPLLRSRPMLVSRFGEKEPRLYCPLPSRSGISSPMGRTLAVGSEEDLIARLALERRMQAEEACRALKREKRKKAAKRGSDNDEILVKKQKVRDEPTVPSKASGLSGPQTMVSRPVGKPKPLSRTRSCPSVSDLMKTVLWL